MALDDHDIREIARVVIHAVGNIVESEVEKAIWERLNALREEMLECVRVLHEQDTWLRACIWAGQMQAVTDVESESWGMFVQSEYERIMGEGEGEGEGGEGGEGGMGEGEGDEGVVDGGEPHTVGMDDGVGVEGQAGVKKKVRRR